MKRPSVGVGVIIQNKEGKILIGKRKGSHAPYFSIPGGHLELGETFEQAAIREIYEETSITIKDPKVISVTNNLRTYAEEQNHSISVILYVNEFDGTPKIMEEDKCEMWNWFYPEQLPQPHFDASEIGVACFLQNRFYIAGESL